MEIPKIHAPNAIPQAVETLQRYLQAQNDQAIAFQQGQTLQFGWMIFKVIENQSSLALWAPKQFSWPIEFEEDCSQAINLVLTQKYLVESFCTEFEWCNLRDNALVLKGFTENSKIFMNRTDRRESNRSGWFFGAADSIRDANDPANLEVMSLWEVLSLFPPAADFLLLPQNWQVLFQHHPTVLQDYEEAKYASDSYFSKKYIKN
ncbi:MAG: hypothetical protein KDC71_02225 [Acidobacteria bacterium]|nr:hypothetical protein [Acidobacteriota bacterium]